MTEHTFKLPDIGEGIAEAELAEWLVQVGQIIREDDVICEVTTDKATVEIPASIGGKVTWLGGKPGEVMAIGSDLIRIDTDEDVTVVEEADVVAEAAAPDPSPGDATAAPADPKSAPTPAAAPVEPVAVEAPPVPPRLDGPTLLSLGATGKPLAAPSVRGRARSLGIDLRRLRGSGPAGRILHQDLDAYTAGHAEPAQPSARPARTSTEEIRVTGVRRKIAERMAEAKRKVPHFSIIEEIDVEALEQLRETLNRRYGETHGRLTVLPFLFRALSQAVLDHPEINGHYDDEASVVTRFQALHCGVATQTDGGLMVPVLRHVEARDLWDIAGGIRRLSDAARARKSLPEDLTGSTLTVTSLGPLGALATTPIINRPEVAIVGVNKIAVRPVWDGTDFVPRRMMNLSCSFDHRVVDGWNAAQFVQSLKTLLETPALIFMEPAK